MRHGLLLTIGLSLGGIAFAVPPQAPLPPQAPENMVVLCPCACDAGSPCDCDVCPSGILATVSAIVATATQPAQAPTAKAVAETVLLPASEVVSVRSRRHLLRHRTKATSVVYPGSVLVPFEQQAALVAKGWTFADGGTLACVGGNCAVAGFAGSYPAGSYVLSQSMSNGGCASGSCGTSRGIFGRRR